MADTYVEELTVRTERDTRTGRLVREEFLLGKEWHRVGAPADRRFCPNSGKLFEESWWRNGLPFRADGGPCATEWDIESGRVTHQVWITEHGLHREGGLPARITWDPVTGTVLTETYSEFGKEHNELGPSYVKRAPSTGIIVRERWKLHDQFTRGGDNPAYIERDPSSGLVTREEFWIDGVRDRASGPAVIERDSETGMIVDQEFYRRGQTIKPRTPKSDWSP